MRNRRRQADHDRSTRRRSSRGSVAIIAGLLAPVLIGVGALAVDATTAYMEREVLQHVADAAALAGALAYTHTNNTTAAEQSIADIVEANGYSAAVIQAPTSAFLRVSPVNAAASAIQVRLATASPTFFAEIFSQVSALQVSAYALAQIRTTNNGASVCVLALSNLIVDSAIYLTSCGLAANSVGSQAVLVNGGAAITASVVTTPGTVVSNGSINATVTTGALAVADPFVAAETASSAGFKSCVNYANQKTLTAGCWSNVNVNSGSTLTLGSGTFYFTGMNLNSGASLVATAGTTIVLESNWSPNGSVTINAPTSGTFAGLAVVALGGLNINSGVSYAINGTIDASTGALNPDAASWNENDCTGLIGLTITFNGGSKFTIPQTGCSKYNFPGPVVTKTGNSTVALAE